MQPPSIAVLNDRQRIGCNDSSLHPATHAGDGFELNRGRLDVDGGSYAEVQGLVGVLKTDNTIGEEDQNVSILLPRVVAEIKS